MNYDINELLLTNNPILEIQDITLQLAENFFNAKNAHLESYKRRPCLIFTPKI